MRAIRIAGPSGVGKTALAGAVAAEAAAGGWLVVNSTSFRIHAALPLFAARRILQTLLDALGDDADRYSSGLTIDRDRAEDFEEAFLRIFEGVTLDHRVLLIIDDAQWADAQSRALIERLATRLADRTIVLLYAERVGENDAPLFALQDEAIALGDLTAQAAAQIVRDIYPGLTDELANGIVEQTQGRAVDIVAVATAARESGASTARELSVSTRRVVARDLSLLDADVRTFLQICALIDEPIEFVLLAQLWPRDRLLEMISSVSGRYLIEAGDGLRFVHSTVMESVLETIPIEMPMRYRIVDALKKLPAPRLEDYERLVKQSAACGDRDLERETLLKLAHDATAKSLHTLATSAIERAIKIAPPTPEELVPLYTQLSQLYNAIGRVGDAVRVCREALVRANSYDMVEGLGGIAASLLIGMQWNGQGAEAMSELRHYLERFRSDSDRAQLLCVGEFLAMNANDTISAEDFAESFERLRASANPLVVVRHHVARAFLALRSGKERAALERARDAERAAESLPAIVSTMPRAVRMLHAFRFGGTRAAERFLEVRDDELNEGMIHLLQATTLLCHGKLGDARDFVTDILDRYAETNMRRELLSAYAFAAALQGLRSDDPAWGIVRADISSFNAGDRSCTLANPLSAWALATAADSSENVRSLLLDVAPLFGKIPDLLTSQYPILLVLAAQKAGERELLAAAASGATFWSDEQPWHRAHLLLARGAATAALGGDDAAALLAGARALFVSLEAPYFADLADKLTAGGRAAVKAPGEKSPANTTRREREIAALVAEGLTNREVAERLVLSERTVEGHIANLFAKVNVNSRTQLATWYLRAVGSSSVA